MSTIDEDNTTPVRPQINDLLNSEELAKAVETESFRDFLDQIPIAIVIAKLIRGTHRVCYANQTFEALLGRPPAEFLGGGWSVLADFHDETNPAITLQGVLERGGEEFLGTFRTEGATPIVADVYCGNVESEEGVERYQIAALIDITSRDRKQWEEYARKMHDRDLLFKEIQHRVKNNLQLVVALIRFEARSARRGDTVDWDAVAGRVASLQFLYEALSPDALVREVDLGHYLNQIATAVMNAFAVDGIRLDVKVEHTPCSINIALPLGLAVNEVLTNSFKHAFAGRGHGVITLECLRKGADQYRVVIGDDGIGLPADVQWPTPGKINALIMRTLHENTKATVDVETAPGKGVRVVITLDHGVPPRPPS